MCSEKQRKPAHRERRGGRRRARWRRRAGGAVRAARLLLAACDASQCWPRVIWPASAFWRILHPPTRPARPVAVRLGGALRPLPGLWNNSFFLSPYPYPPGLVPYPSPTVPYPSPTVLSLALLSCPILCRVLGPLQRSIPKASGADFSKGAPRARRRVPSTDGWGADRAVSNVKVRRCAALRAIGP